MGSKPSLLRTKPSQGVDPKSHVGGFTVKKVTDRTRQGQHQNNKALIRSAVQRVQKAPR
jgi:hypothetical protein